MPKTLRMDGCSHALDPTWCYLCRIDAAGVEPHVAWGLEDWDQPRLEAWEDANGPMTDQQAAYLRFLCDEFGVAFDAGLNEGEVALVVDSFVAEPMTDAQGLTLERLAERVGTGSEVEALSYGQARAEIRRLVALKGLRAAG
jgi:hypothetical protein